MRRMLTSAAALLLAASAPGVADAQERMDDTPRISRFDLGVYVGGALTSRWYESRTITLNGTTDPIENDDAEDYSPGYSPVFGAQATYWLTPMLGVRANGLYAPMRIPTESDGFFDAGEELGEGSTYQVNTYMYDLALALRPFIRSDNWYRTAYLFAGGGGVTSNLAGDADACEPFTLSRGACLTYDQDHATVGQGTAGAGITLLNLTSSLGLFGELAAHIYDSPVHVGDGWTGPIVAPQGSTVRIADDRTAVTGRAVIGLKAMLGDFTPPPAPFVPPPPPPPVVEAPIVTPPPAPAPVSDIQVCVLQDGNLTSVTGQYNSATGDTTVNGQPFATAFP
ncbi:MAG TPA: hypothetical protein VGB66_01950, partial [Longimicrobium sp.]